MVYKTPHRTLKNEQYEPTKNKQWSTKHCTEHWRMSNTNPIKNKQWSTKHCTEHWRMSNTNPTKYKQWSTKHHTEHWRMSNTNPLKTNNGQQNTAQNTEEWAIRTPLKQTMDYKTPNRTLVRIAHSSVFCVVFCRPLFVLVGFVLLILQCSVQCFVDHCLFSTKNKQWSTKHYTEHWRMSNTNPLKTNMVYKTLHRTLKNEQYEPH
jgi:hypothetical protein